MKGLGQLTYGNFEYKALTAVADASVTNETASSSVNTSHTPSHARIKNEHFASKLQHARHDMMMHERTCSSRGEARA